MDMDDALQTFMAEGHELLEDMENALLSIESDPDNEDTINAIFRAAHTIKGSAGLFGLNYLVTFTHVVESVLDRVRAREVAISTDLVALLLSSCDHLTDLMDWVARGEDDVSDSLARKSLGIEENLKVFLDTPVAGAGEQVSADSSAAEDGHSADVDADEPPVAEPALTEKDLWHISLRFGPDVLRHGMDPVSFIRYLATLGTIHHIETLLDAIPDAGNMDPETCYTGFEISLHSTQSKEAIEGVFEFVSEESQIHILAPDCLQEEYIRLIKALPEEDMKLGEILVRCGTLTHRELESALQQQQSSGNSLQPIGEMLVEKNVVNSEVVNAAVRKQKTVKEARPPEASLIRVDADKLDNLINLVGELIIAGAGTNILALRSGQSDLIESTETLSRLVEEVRDSALNLRMVQIGSTFNRFQRVVRDVSQELGKDIRLTINGGDTELDKTVVEKIADPLTHLVRNSMDHGIEAEEVRLAAGKPAHGSLMLNAYHDAGSIVIEVSDDGGGIHKDRILSKAIEKGLISENSAAAMTDKDIFNLVFEPGFSTADQVSNLSGRGVGMDVVRRNIESLRGTVEMDSQDGQGTMARIRLPLTLAIIDGFLVGVNQSAYVIPLDMVVECVEYGAWKESDNSHCLNLRGEVLPYIRLSEYFETQNPGHSSERESVVVVRFGDSKVGLVVDRLMGEFQTVIKPLGKLFNGVGGISGFTILGSGDVVLILDIPSLINDAGTLLYQTDRQAMTA
ncbi:MAG: chemotaxis protein CheA [Oceanospirillaceae bacterium]|nr:chemotaxis protein CheA [Oceanospirillaceae bacterium]MBT13204.1 chemotaxis protein CheA [Oceanospirillaceae bacterium]